MQIPGQIWVQINSKDQLKDVATRFIPAGAGNTTIWPDTRRRRSVHPRWRGEHTMKVRRCGQMSGSSPLARGTPFRHVVGHCIARFIPAGAGNTAALAAEGIPTPVHPRWRGEHYKSGERFSLRDRFIPAGAGNTTGMY